jgi:hypothetical protein
MMSSSLSRNSKIKLTPAGKALNDNGRLDGTTAGDILVYLAENGSSYIFDVSTYQNETDEKIKSEANRLLRTGYIEEAVESPESSMEEEELLS